MVTTSSGIAMAMKTNHIVDRGEGELDAVPGRRVGRNRPIPRAIESLMRRQACMPPTSFFAPWRVVSDGSLGAGGSASTSLMMDSSISMSGGYSSDGGVCTLGIEAGKFASDFSCAGMEYAEAGASLVSE